MKQPSPLTFNYGRDTFLEWPAYGTRRMKAELNRRGWKVNRKRVQRLLRRETPSACAAVLKL